MNTTEATFKMLELTSELAESKIHSLVVVSDGKDYLTNSSGTLGVLISCAAVAVSHIADKIMRELNEKSDDKVTHDEVVREVLASTIPKALKSIEFLKAN